MNKTLWHNEFIGFLSSNKSTKEKAVFLSSLPNTFHEEYLALAQQILTSMDYKEFLSCIPQNLYT